MKKLMYIYPEAEEGIESLKSEIGESLAFSESIEGFICFEETFKELDKKYHFTETNENDESNYICYELGDFLEDNWLDMDECITLRSDYGDSEKIEHCISDDYEIVLSLYTDDDKSINAQVDENTKEFFGSDDWYLYITQKCKSIMIDLLIDSIKANAKFEMDLTNN